MIVVVKRKNPTYLHTQSLNRDQVLHTYTQSLCHAEMLRYGPAFSIEQTLMANADYLNGF